MGRTTCTEPQCLYKGALYFFLPCNTLLRNLLLRIRGYQKSFPRFKFLILDTCNPDTIHASKDLGIRGYFSKPKGVREHKSLWNASRRLQWEGAERLE